MKIIILFTAFVIISCASTPQKRIKEKEAEFLSYPPEVQGMIQNGEVDKGFNKDMVYISKGDPDERDQYKHPKSGRIIEVWKYKMGKPELIEQRGATPPGFQGAYSSSTPGQPVRPIPMFYSTPKFIIEFEDDKVTSWKQR